MTYFVLWLTNNEWATQIDVTKQVWLHRVNFPRSMIWKLTWKLLKFHDFIAYGCHAWHYYKGMDIIIFHDYIIFKAIQAIWKHRLHCINLVGGGVTWSLLVQSWITFLCQFFYVT
jgi:hypothetical protein